MDSLKTAVAEKIQIGSNEILQDVAEILAKKVIDKRVNLAVSAYTELDNIENELNRLRPDIKQYDGEGKELRFYSAEQREKRKKAEERKDKISKLLTAALQDPSKFGDLANAIGQKNEKAAEAA